MKFTPRKLIAAALLLSSCTPPNTYVAADEAIYNAIAPDYRAYVEIDNSLTEQGKATRLRTLKAWRRMIDTAKRKTK